MLVLEIKREEAAGESGRFSLQMNDTCWQAHPEPVLSASSKDLLRWYFDDYIDKDPFSTSREREAVDVLDTYGPKLASSLELERCCEETLAADVLVKVDANVSDNGYTNFYWEVLEDAFLWPFHRRPKTVKVLRSIAVAECRAPPAEDAWLTAWTGQVNILVVAARLDDPDHTDIPYRLVSKVILKKIAASNRLIHLNIVRPATYEALCQHLTQRARGCYQLVHFDVHGVQHNKKSWLQFIRRRDSRYEPHLVDAESLAQLLVENGVRYVAMNACRSATSTSTSRNLAIELIRHGICAVTAMSHKVTSSAVSTFVDAFYDAIFNQSCTMDEATAIGRKYLAKSPLRTSRTGYRFRVRDFLVPICYTRQGYQMHTFDADCLDGQKTWTHLEFLKDEDEDLIGRERDMHHLENNLLLDSNIGILSGVAGSGKTVLMEYMRQWWEATGLVKETIWANLDHMEARIDLQYISEILSDIILDKNAIPVDSLCEYLKKTPYLIVLDGIDSYLCPKDSSLNKQRKHLKQFLRSIHGGQTLVVITSRFPEVWLDNLGSGSCGADESHPSVFSQSLPGITATFGASLLLRRMKSRDFEIQDVSEEALSYLEQTSKLVEGNPLALELLAIDQAYKRTSPSEYFYELMKGSPIKIDQRWLRSHEVRSVFELQEMHDIAVNPTEEQKERHQQALFCAILMDERVPLDCLIHAISPASLGLNWNFIFHDLVWLQLYFQAFNGLKQLRKTDLLKLASEEQTQLVRVGLLNSEISQTLIDAVMETEQVQQLKKMAEDMLNNLQVSSFVQTSTTSSSTFASKRIWRLHPLVTIVARTNDEYRANKANDETAFTFFQILYASRQPLKYFYWNEVWAARRPEIARLFPNLLSAAFFIVQQDVTDFLLEMQLNSLLTVLNKALKSDVSRTKLLRPLWLLSVQRAMDNFKKFSNDQDISHIDFPPLIIQDEKPHTSGNESNRTVLLLALAIQVSMTFGVWTLDVTPEQHRPKLEEVKLILRDAQERLSVSTEDVKLVFDTAGHLKLFDWIINSIELRLGDTDLSTNWNLRTQFVRAGIEGAGVEGFPEEQSSWLDIPREVNGTSQNVNAVLDTELAVKTLISMSKFETAKALVLHNIAMEVNSGANEIENRARLLELLAWVNEKESNWEDAISTLNKAHELWDQLDHDSNSLERIEREGKIAKLYDLSGDPKTTETYITRLISKANWAHQKRRHAMEIECLVQVAFLPYAARLDGLVSRIFLLLRIALITYRTPVTYNDKPRGRMIVDLLSTTNKSQPNWVYGAPDGRTQTIAVSFLLHMFGAYINFYYCNTFVHAELDDPEMEARVMGFGKELEARLFSAHPPSIKYTSPNMDFEPQRLLFEHLWFQGTAYLNRSSSTADETGITVFPPAPFTPCTVWGTTGTGGFFGGTVSTPHNYICPTRLMLQLSGFIMHQDGEDI